MSVYEMAVKWRQEFRHAYRDEREKNKSLTKQFDVYGLALMMIAEGVAEPERVARDALDKVSLLRAGGGGR